MLDAVTDVDEIRHEERDSVERVTPLHEEQEDHDSQRKAVVVGGPVKGREVPHLTLWSSEFGLPDATTQTLPPNRDLE
jgi:hypothetical protein